MKEMKIIKMIILTGFLTCSYNLLAYAENVEFEYVKDFPTDEAMRQLGDKLGCTIVKGPEELGAKLPSRLATPFGGINKDKAYEIFYQWLMDLSKKKTAIRNRVNRTLTIVPLDKNISKREIPSDIDIYTTNLADSAEIIKITKTIKGFDAKSAVSELKTDLSEWGSIESDDKANTITIVDTSTKVKRLLEKLETSEKGYTEYIAGLKSKVFTCVQNPPKIVGEMILKSLGWSADDAKNYLEGKGEIRSTGGFRGRISVVISGTNNLAVTGTENEIKVAEEQWKILEKETQINTIAKLGDIEYKSYFLKNAFASDVIRILSLLFYQVYKAEVPANSGAIADNIKLAFYQEAASLVQVGGQSGQPGQPTQPGGQMGGSGTNADAGAWVYPPRPESLPEMQSIARYTFSMGGVVGTAGCKVTFMEDGRNNGIIVLSQKENFPIIERVIDDLDKPTRQVFVDVLIMEVALTDDFKWGVGARINQDYFPDTTIPFRGRLQPTTVNDTTQTIRYADPGTAVYSDKVVDTLGSDSNVNLFVFNYKSLQGILEHIQSKTNYNTIASPKILTTNNRVAQFTIQEVNVVHTNRTVVTQGQNNPVQTNTNSFYYWIPVGTNIMILPHINDDKEVLLEIGQRITSVLRYVGPESYPWVVARDSRNSALIKDGNTLMIGGIIQENSTQIKSVFPIVGMIPLIGELFNVTSINNNKSEVVMFITPHIISETKDQDKLMLEQGERYKMIPAGDLTPGQFKPSFKK